jgi:two-component system phosphate regulon sensor histidine kinase PhoR
MTGRVFTKLLFSFLLVLSIGTAILDFSVRRIVQYSLTAQARSFYADRAQNMARQLAVAPSGALPGLVEAQALAAHADITLLDTSRRAVAQAFGASGDPLRPAEYTPSDIPSDTSSLAPNSIPSPAGAAGETVTIELPAGSYRARFAFSLRALHATLDLLRRDLLFASLLALALATLMAAFLARRAALRLGRILRFANRIAAGELSARVEEGRLDEISEVAHALDATAARLEASFRALDGSRRELAVLLDSMGEAVIGISAASQVTWTNSKMKAILPFVREGRSLVECIRDPEVLRSVGVAMREGGLGRGRATGFVPGRAFSVSAAPMPGGGAVVVLHDVTDAERAERMRRDFVANVSHELRTPLTSISGYVETVLDDPSLSDQAREFLAIVLRNATRMNRLTADLLALANVEGGDYRIQPLAIPANLLLDDALDALAGMAIDSGVVIERSPATASPVLADPDALQQVFGNLIENAIKYGRSGRRVRVGARDAVSETGTGAGTEAGTAAGTTVEFSVQDFGPGIASEHLYRIFERFYRVDKARSRDSGGTGLGLAIVKHIVLAHGGAIRVESELGAGATFIFTLPRVPSATVLDRPTPSENATTYSTP